MLSLLLLTLAITVAICIIIFLVTAYLKKTSWGPMVICVLALPFIIASVPLTANMSSTNTQQHTKKELRQLETLQTVKVKKKKNIQQAQPRNFGNKSDKISILGDVTNHNSVSPLGFHKTQRKTNKPNKDKYPKKQNDALIVSYELKSSK
ncbi:MAG: hypothetical protein ABF575_00095 [Liquorilactobacillus hordei]|uniref:hypothetical protein n=1 Tax=Liquorilactobacillus hordei TaxID=468911 RepID=UPI0039E9F240